MTKRAKSKASKGSSKSSKAQTDLPELVIVMAKIAERLEALEKKLDLGFQQMTSRIADIKQAMQHAPRQESVAHGSPRSEPQVKQNPGRTLYQVVCADCCKHCEVPFKPADGRPVYCKECFAKRKAGHVPQDPDKRVPVTKTFKPEVLTLPEDLSKKAAAKDKKSKGKSSAKKKKK